MKLEEQVHQIDDRGKIELIGHQELLGKNKQIIRLKEEFFTKIDNLLKNGENISLYNHYNPINIDLIRAFLKEQEKNNGAMISKIIDRNSLGPILCGDSLTGVEVTEMININFEDIKDEDLIKSICEFGGDISVDKLINWLSEKFYGGEMSVNEIIEARQLFFRQIKLFNN